MNIQHSSKTSEWYTPPDIIKRVKEVMPCIDFDPASCYEANKRVGARQYCESKSLETSWGSGSIYLNPPGGKIGNKSQAIEFWKKLMLHRESRLDFSHAIFMAFSLEALQTTQNKGCKSILEFPFCVPAKRIKFLYEGRYEASAPSHSNVIVYVPGYLDEVNKFYEAFKDLGAVKL